MHFTYDCEAWTILKQLQKKRGNRMWFPRRMPRISWTARKSNETVLREANTRSLITLTEYVSSKQSHLAIGMRRVREAKTSCENWNDRRKTQDVRLSFFGFFSQFNHFYKQNNHVRVVLDFVCFLHRCFPRTCQAKTSWFCP